MLEKHSAKRLLSEAMVMKRMRIKMMMMIMTTQLNHSAQPLSYPSRPGISSMLGVTTDHLMFQE